MKPLLLSVLTVFGVMLLIMREIANPQLNWHLCVLIALIAAGMQFVLGGIGIRRI